MNKIVDLCMCVKELEHVGKISSKYVNRKHQWNLIQLHDSFANQTTLSSMPQKRMITPRIIIKFSYLIE